MKNIFFILAFISAALVCGCDRQTKVNMQKIEIMSEKMVQLQQSQAKQMAQFQTQITALAPMLDKTNSIYFEKTRDDALFYHTNQLYLILTVDKNIESELKVASSEREAQNSLAYEYHTNSMDLMHSYAVQIQDALTSQEGRLREVLAGQENRIVDKVNSGTGQATTNLGDALLKQIKLTVPDAAQTAKLREIEADLAQIKKDLAAIKSQLPLPTNPPAVNF